MKLRKKTLIIIGVTITSLIAILYATSQTILLSSYAALEEQDTCQNLERVQNALSGDLYDLELLTRDWSAWDDTYDFIQNSNEDYVDSNLIDETFIAYEYNVMVFVNSSGGIVFSKFFDLENEEEIPIPESLMEHLSPNDLILQHLDINSSITGIILLPENPLLVSSCPIVTSDDQGPIRGTLIMGHYLDSAQINSLAETTQLSLNVQRFNDSQMPPDFQTALASLSEEAPIFTRPLNEESIAGYTLFEDIYGEPSLVLRVDIPRSIYKQGQASIFYLILLLLATGVVFSIVITLLLEKTVLSRLARLSASVNNVRSHGDLSERVSIAGKDELSSLAGEINRMLAALEQSQGKLRHYSEHLEELVKERTKKLRLAQEQLLKAERLAAIGEVAAMVGHDLRNPLTGIAGATYYLKMEFGPKMDKKTKEMLEVIEKDIEYSNKIINSLLDYSKEIRLELAETTPKSIIKGTLTLVKVPKNIQILNLTENKPKIEIDVQQMKRVFVNIIKNAIDTMSEGGKLTITNKESNGNLEIAFTDTGTGIPKDLVEKIWTPLFTTKAKGMGLGLPICKRIVEAHKGSISVKNTVGKGTTFTVTLPTKPKIKGGEKTWVNVPESLLSKTTKA